MTIPDFIKSNASAILSGFFGISGVLIGFFLVSGRDLIREKRIRRRLCSGILAEIGRLSKQMELIFTNSEVGTIGSLALYYPFIGGPKECVPLFKPFSVEVISGLSGLLSELKRMLDENNSNPNEELRNRIVVMAQNIYSLCAIAMIQLAETEKGNIPEYKGFKDNNHIKEVANDASNPFLQRTRFTRG